MVGEGSEGKGGQGRNGWEEKEGVGREERGVREGGTTGWAGGREEVGRSVCSAVTLDISHVVTDGNE